MRKNQNKKLFCRSVFYLFFFVFLLLSVAVLRESIATPLSNDKFPNYLQNSVVVRITGCFNWWLKENFKLIFADDGSSGSADDICPPGQWAVIPPATEPSFSSSKVPCAWKTLNMINAIMMHFLDKQQDNDPVMCCCDPVKDPWSCTGPITPGCPAQFPNRGKCMDLKPEATNYYVIQGYQAWGVTWVSSPGSSTAYWSGLLDQCITLPMLGNVCINLSLNDVCNGASCGPVAGYNGTTHPGYCLYPPATGGSANVCDDNAYQSTVRDNWILRYNPVGGPSINFFVGESDGVPCGLPAGSYNGKTFTGNEGFLTIELQLGDFSKPILIDIDASTPSPGNVTTFTNSPNPPPAVNVAPGKTDCDDINDANFQGNCYVRAYLRAIGTLKIRIGGTLYLEHRTYSWPHQQVFGLAVREISFAESPWITLALRWIWSEGGCADPDNVCVRKNVTGKVKDLVPFIDTVLRGLFRYSDILPGIRQYFGPILFDISGTTQQKMSNLFPTWVRPIKADDLLLDIALGGDQVAGSQILRSKSCYASGGVGPGGGSQDELYLISSAMIDLDLFREGTNLEDTNQLADHKLPGCGYLGPPYHPAPPLPAGPSTVDKLPHAGNPDSGALSCNADATHIGISIFQNVFTYLVSDIASSGIMCLALSKKGETRASEIPLPLWTVGQMKLVMPQLYNFLEAEFGSGITDIPVILVFKPKPGAAYPGFPQTPQVQFVDDTTPFDPLPITADILLTLPNNDFEIWIDVDKEIEQWGLGPGEVGGVCDYGLTPPPDPGSWCATSNFPNGSTPPAKIDIDVGPAGNAFRNNFPDCVAWIDCDTTVGNPSDRIRERRFIGQFNVGVTFALDLNLYGCGRGSGKVFGNLPAFGFPISWYNPWDPTQVGNCTTVSHLRRVDLTLGVVSRIGAVDVMNDSGTPKVYYPFSEGTFASYIAEFVASIISSTLALDAQVGYTLSAILDPADNLYSAIPANNDVFRIGGHAKGATADRLTYTYIARDDVGNPGPHPDINYQNKFLTIAIDLQGFIHPDFFYGIISQALSGSTSFPAAPPFVGREKSDHNSLNSLAELWQKISSGEEYFISFRDIQEFVKKVEKSGLVVPMKKNENGGIDDFPPETVVEYVHASQPKTIIKLSCVDDYTKPDNCWFGWRWKGRMWRPWVQSDTIEIRGLPDGEYEIEVRALDERAIPDITPATVKFVVDDTPPSIFFPKKAFFKRGDVLRVELWDYITKPDEIEVSYKIDNSEWSSWQKVDFNDKGLGIKLIRLPDEVGTHKIIVKARDRKGNIETREFYFDIGVPAKGIFSCSR